MTPRGRDRFTYENFDNAPGFSKGINVASERGHVSESRIKMHSKPHCNYMCVCVCACVLNTCCKYTVESTATPAPVQGGRNPWRISATFARVAAPGVGSSFMHTGLSSAAVSALSTCTTPLPSFRRVPAAAPLGPRARPDASCVLTMLLAAPVCACAVVIVRLARVHGQHERPHIDT